MISSERSQKLEKRLRDCVQNFADYDKLLEINMLISNCSKSEVQDVFREIPIEQVIDSIPWSDSDVCIEALKLLKYITEHNLFGDIWQHIGLISAGLGTDEEDVLLFLCKELASSFGTLNKGKGGHTAPSKDAVTEVLRQLITLFGHEASRVFTASKNALLVFVNTSTQVLYLFVEPTLKTAWTTLCEKKENQLRVFEFCIDLVSKNQSLFPAMEEAGLLTECSNLLMRVNLFAHDPLVELNYIELLGNLIDIQPQGWEYTMKNHIFEHISSLCVSIEEDPLRLELTLPGYVKFFGRVARYDFNLAVQQLAPLKTLLTMCLEENMDFTRRLLAIETVAHIVHDSSRQREDVDREMGSFLVMCLECLGRLCIQGHSPAPVRCRALETWSVLLSSSSSDSIHSEAITENWFLIISRAYVSDNLPPNSPLSQVIHKVFMLLRTIAEQPFQELRLAVLRLFLTISTYRWALQMFHEAAGFQEYLLNRNTELEKEGRDAKYALVRAIVQSPAFDEHIFGPEFTLKLREYVNQGPLFIRAEARVALEDAD